MSNVPGENVMTTVISRERDTIEIEPLPEYVREESTYRKEVSNAMPSINQERWERPTTPSPIVESEAPQSDVLEALWPGVHQDFTHAHAPRRGPSFYMTVGFMGGAIVSMLGIWGFSAVSSVVATTGTPAKNQQVVATAAASQQPAAASQTGELITPAVTTYEVASGDTLAGIAIKNYKVASPRLLDEICRANGMRNANVLSLGQKITLPEYHRSTSQVASTTSNVVQ